MWLEIPQALVERGQAFEVPLGHLRQRHGLGWVPGEELRHAAAEQPVSNISIVPTLLELLGHALPDRLPGQSLLPVLTGARPQPADVFVEWNGAKDDPSARTVVTADGWKLALYDKDNCLLFDRNKDPLELENLYYRSESRDVIQRLRGKIEDWQERTADTCSLPRTV